MKTQINLAAIRTILIIAGISGLLISQSQAKSPAANGPASSTFTIVSCAPVTPAVADFDDPVPEKTLFHLNLLVDKTKEGSFNDESDVQLESPEFLKSIAPVTPAEADFEDSDPVQEVTTAVNFCGPDVPSEAAFDEN
jgi:hypothetical protein